MRKVPALLLVCTLLTIAVTAQIRRVDDAALKRAGETGDEWLTYGLTQAETRYSPLTQINTANVSRLGSGLVLRRRARAAAARKRRRWSGTARSTASPTGAWSSPSMRAPAKSAGAGIRK